MREVIIYRAKTPCHMNELREGDIFRILPCGVDDDNCPRELLIATSNASAATDVGDGVTQVYAYKLVTDC